ncbi:MULTISPECIES: hypothetical protein [unclassified Bradyrhizobium]
MSAKAIAENAKKLHTYTVPSVAAWSTDKIAGVLARGRHPLDADFLWWVNQTPKRETEVLFLGGNLAGYRTASKDNPHRPDRTKDSLAPARDILEGPEYKRPQQKPTTPLNNLYSRGTE